MKDKSSVLCICQAMLEQSFVVLNRPGTGVLVCRCCRIVISIFDFRQIWLVLRFVGLPLVQPRAASVLEIIQSSVLLCHLTFQFRFHLFGWTVMLRHHGSLERVCSVLPGFFVIHSSFPKYQCNYPQYRDLSSNVQDDYKIWSTI